MGSFKKGVQKQFNIKFASSDTTKPFRVGPTVQYKSKKEEEKKKKKKESMKIVRNTSFLDILVAGLFILLIIVAATMPVDDSYACKFFKGVILFF